MYQQYTCECSYYGANLIKEKVEDNNIDFIIGLGVGKLIDLVGCSRHITNKAYAVVPTLASNCAPWTPLSVRYKESCESEGKSEHFFRHAAFLLTTPSLVIDSPFRYFKDGIADTLTKSYEFDLILNQEEFLNIPFLQMTKYTTELSKEVILVDSEKTVEDMENGVVSEKFKNVSEIIFRTAELVGGLGSW